MSSLQATRALTFTSGIGVNVHVEYTDGKYANTANVITDLKYLGVSLVRDGNLNPSNQGQANYATLAKAGIKFDLIVSGSETLGQNVAQMLSFAKADPGAIFAVEGPNEINNWPITYNGLTGNTAAVQYQTDLYADIQGSALAGTTVYAFTGGTPVSGYNDIAIHPYPQGGNEPITAPGGIGATPKVPTVVTEMGYATMPTTWNGVDAATQAKLTLNALFDDAKLGIGTTYLYELLDAYADPNNTDLGKHFGLFNLDNSPKPVATAIHDLMAILQDTGSKAGSFAPGALSFTLSALPATASDLLYEKSNGAFDLVLWNEPSIWNPSTHTEVAAESVPVTVKLAASYGVVEVFDPLVSSKPIEILHNVSQVQVGLVDHPLIIEVEPNTGTVSTTVSDMIQYNNLGQATSQAFYDASGDLLATSHLTYNAAGQVSGKTLSYSAHYLGLIESHFTSVTADTQGDSIIHYDNGHSITLIGFTPAELYSASGHFF